MPDDQRSRQSLRGDTLRPGGGPSPPLPRTPARRTTTTLADISARLQPRDRVIAFLLSDHTALTTDQIAAVLFDSPITCGHRLYTLRRMDFINRVLRAHPGQPTHVYWVPGRLSARLVALARGENPPTPKAVALAADRVLSDRTRRHTIETNQFFIDLLTRSRSHPQSRLTRWWSEQQTTAAFGRRIRPDGHGVWTTGHHHAGFWLEHDRGTEHHPRLRDKLEPYRRLRIDGGPDCTLLFSLPTRERERHFHHRLIDTAGRDHRIAAALATLTIATCARDRINGHGPAGPIWRLVGNGGHRLRLADLPTTDEEPGPLNPGPPTPDHDPLHELT
ncbi:replication-relaxation family protein [Verrucosispora sp. WMMD573]|uniref:replication-relaxation family protein n=1 Tax=Verrucosispora sp. WMMD573 TaxID=3015149 RepID=UPI00248C1D1D|nr:replication-relaxation family protein [Verrucosispora sp. WMMD573]WBB52420.1 replication-relaxation family protein [Verrucosispora sp. WMMD573]